jgi:hypothetical protein
MKKVGKDASLAEKAVQAVAKGDVPTTPRKPRRLAPVASEGPSTDVHTHIKVDKKVMQSAWGIIADESNLYSRLEIVDAETVIVR